MKELKNEYLRNSELKNRDGSSATSRFNIKLLSQTLSYCRHFVLHFSLNSYFSPLLSSVVSSKSLYLAY